MEWIDSLVPFVTVLISFLTGLIIFLIPEKKQITRNILNGIGAIAHLSLVLWMLGGVFQKHEYEFKFVMAEAIFSLRADAMALLLSTLSAFLWFFTTIYAIGYLKDTENQSRFFGFFSLCVTATIGIALANNLFTFFIFYEFLTFATYPLVVHKGTEKALKAGRLYLSYTLGGGALFFLGIAWLYSIAGPVQFTEGGVLAALNTDTHHQLYYIFFMLILGIGVKAAIVPFHGWLPNAMVAPAPVSALLHAVAVVKAGAFGIVRIVYDVYGIKFASLLEVTTPLAIMASVTIIYGSIRAVYQDDIKRRLAFSTVSQVSYIALGVAIAGPVATIGGLVHLVHQGIMKITLFFCAGGFAETVNVTKVSQMGGLGRRMPVSAMAFTIASFGMIGVPPLAGFISKWYLGLGALEAGQGHFIWVLLISSLLNSIYFLPIIYAMWFKPIDHSLWNEKIPIWGLVESRWQLIVPPAITAIFVIVVGVLASSLYSPLSWVKLITDREYLP
jgi:multicomponent Na+:H+ antiporter subunit D